MSRRDSSTALTSLSASATDLAVRSGSWEIRSHGSNVMLIWQMTLRQAIFQGARVTAVADRPLTAGRAPTCPSRRPDQRGSGPRHEPLHDVGHPTPATEGATR